MTDIFTNTTAASYTGYEYNEIQVYVPHSTEAGASISAGDTLMLTKSGAYCADNVTSCYSEMKSSFGQVTVTVINGLTNAPVPNARVNFVMYWYPTVTGTTPAFTTNTLGQVLFSNHQYGAYSAVVNGSTAYQGNTVRVAVQSAATDVKLVLLPNNTGSDYILSMNVPMASDDLDLNLDVKSINGTTCRVNAENKYCAYARYVRDDLGTSGGSEVIEISKFSVSLYMAWVGKATPGVTGCSQDKMRKGNSTDGFGFLQALTLNS